MIWYIDDLQEKVVRTAGLASAKQYSQAVYAFRTVYTSEVVSAAERSGLDITHDYVDKAAIPLPATLSIMLGNSIASSGEGTSVSLYSPYPFPWRAKSGGLVDEFRKNAWENINRDTNLPYFEFTMGDYNSYLRYAVADKMRASCVNCHNTHPDSPKLDWKIDDVRGILEVRLPLDSVIANTNDDLTLTIFIFIFLSLSGISGIFFLVRRHSLEAEKLTAINDDLQTAMSEIRSLQGIIPICSYCHKVRSDGGAWDKLDSYVTQHSEASFSHGICPDCIGIAYAESGIEEENKPPETD